MDDLYNYKEENKIDKSRVFGIATTIVAVFSLSLPFLMVTGVI